MQEIEIKSTFRKRGTIPAFDQEAVKNEPMLFSVDRDFASLHGGPITHAFLTNLPDDWQDCDIIIDSRVHMLMKGWYPCIPGWHLDDVPRTRTDGQPDHLNPAYKAEHILVNVGDCCPTVMLSGTITLQEPEVGELHTEKCPFASTYGKWSKDIDHAVDFEDISGVHASEAPELHLIEFDWQTFHRGQQAHKAGWRFFIRASRNTSRKVLNETRAQVQVYLPIPEEGW